MSSWFLLGVDISAETGGAAARSDDNSRLTTVPVIYEHNETVTTFILLFMTN